MSSINDHTFGPAPHQYQSEKTRTVERVIGRTPEGKIATGPGLPYQRWIDPSGNVINLPIRSVRNQKDAEDPRRYEVYITAKKRRQGWHPYWEFTDDAARNEFIQKRKAGAAVESETYRRAYMAIDDKEQMKTQQGMMRALEAFSANLDRERAAIAAQQARVDLDRAELAKLQDKKRG